MVTAFELCLRPLSCEVHDIRRPFFKNKNQKNSRKNYKLTFNVISLDNGMFEPLKLL